MTPLEQLQESLKRTIKITKDKRFTTLYTVDEQEVYRGHIKELNEEINAEYEAIAFIRQRDEEYRAV